MTIPMGEQLSEQPPFEDEPDLMENDVFLERVERVYEMMQTGNQEQGLTPEQARDRVLAEVYVFICTMEQGIRKMISSGGPLAMAANMFGKKGGV